MKKKTYEKPEILVMQADMDQQILAGSIAGVTTTGLDNDLGYDNDGGDQGSAWARKNDVAWDDEEGEW